MGMEHTLKQGGFTLPGEAGYEKLTLEMAEKWGCLLYTSTYLLMRDLHLLDTMWVLILPLIYSPYNMLIMKTYLQSSIPDSLEESAFLDGASNFQILWKIVLPLSKPIIATLSLFYAVGRWNSYCLLYTSRCV